MAKDTVTLTVDGRVPASLFRRVVTHYTGLLLALSTELAAREEVDWTLDGLIGVEAGATEAGLALRGEAQEIVAVERVVEAYGRVGQALERDERPPYSPSVVRQAKGITSVLNGKVTAVRFQTPDLDATVYSGQANRTAPLRHLRAYGAVTGRVQTLTNRQGLRFTLYDTMFDKAVSCYLREGQEELMRGLWGRTGVVEGLVSRDLLSGRPISIREITNVVSRAEVEPGSFRLARGAVHPAENAEAPETIIRRLRDAS